MRLSKRLQQIIKQSSLVSFGDVGVYLFGSRVDDDKTGGDIDIAIDDNLSQDEFFKKKIIFLSSMVRSGLDLKIDVVQYKTTDKLLYSEIRNHCVKL